jgi:glycerol uptake facilitator-like aquaporin
MTLSKKLGAEFIGTFWLAPILGAILAGIVYRWFQTEE